MSLYNRVVQASLRTNYFRYKMKKLRRKMLLKAHYEFIRDCEKMDRDGFLMEFP